jgi:FMN phosphatase YigB (HAD superfamily)
MALTLEQYAAYLDTRGLTWPAPPEVEAPKARPHLSYLPGIRAVTWSVYGTLLAISGGELYFVHPQPFIMDVALDKTIQEFNMWASMTRKAGKPADYLREVYADVVREQGTLPGAGKNAEILAERVWEAIIKKLLRKDYHFDAGFYGALNEFSAKVAYFFHASLQGTACYSSAAEMLRILTKRGIAQALIADGQCFTPLQLRRGLKEQDSTLELDAIIPAKRRILSHEVGVRKPSEQLFREALVQLRERDIRPDQVLHVGSRIHNDIVPARRLGMRTALFAGDTASLQATAEQLKTPASRPDVLLTRLEQLAEVVPER